VKEFVVYTLSRLGLFVLSYLLVVGVYLLATGGDPVPLFWPFLLAIVVSSIASVYLLKGQRQRFAAVIERRAAAAAERLERSRTKEDEPDS
jgi:hypothetical protein